MEPQISRLHLPFASANVSEALAHGATLNGFKTLAELLEIPLTKLIQLEWITPGIWEELSKIIATLSVTDRE